MRWNRNGISHFRIHNKADTQRRKPSFQLIVDNEIRTIISFKQFPFFSLRFAHYYLAWRCDSDFRFEFFFLLPLFISSSTFYFHCTADGWLFFMIHFKMNRYKEDKKRYTNDWIEHWARIYGNEDKELYTYINVQSGFLGILLCLYLRIYNIFIIHSNKSFDRIYFQHV